MGTLLFIRGVKIEMKLDAFLLTSRDRKRKIQLACRRSESGKKAISHFNFYGSDSERI
jgi:hypothetical protein